MPKHSHSTTRVSFVYSSPMVWFSRTRLAQSASSLQSPLRSSRSAMPTKMPAEPLHPRLARRGVTCFEYPRISPCTMHARHQARQRCSHVIVLHARHKPHDDVLVAASIVLQPPGTSHPMQGPIQAVAEYRLLTFRWLCTIVSTLGSPALHNMGMLGLHVETISREMRWPHYRGRRNKELTHPSRSLNSQPVVHMISPMQIHKSHGLARLPLLQLTCLETSFRDF